MPTPNPLLELDEAMKPETIWQIIVALLALALLGGAGALVVGVAHAGSQLISAGLLLTLQLLVGLLAILAALLAVLASFALGRWMIGAAMVSVAERFAELERRYEAEFKRLRAKRPAWIATLFFITEAVMVLVDKAFDGHERETLIVSFSALIGFWVANQLMTCEERWQQLVGGALWFLVLLSIPVEICLHRNQGPSQFFSSLWDLSPAVKVFFTMVAMSLIVLPTLVLRVGAEGEA
jgi:hypothetical protein